MVMKVAAAEFAGESGSGSQTSTRVTPPASTRAFPLHNNYTSSFNHRYLTRDGGASLLCEAKPRVTPAPGKTPHRHQSTSLTDSLQDQPLLRLPFELSRNNFRTAHRQIEQSQNKVQELIQAATKASTSAQTSNSASPHPSLQHIDAALTRLQTLKRKLKTLDDAQVGIQEQSAARIEHLDELYGIHTLVDVKYEEWSRTRLDRLLVDYLLRKGYTMSARELASEKGIEKLVDVEEFETSGKIERSLREEHRVDVALSWCGENKANLKKINVSRLTAVRCHH
jgi:hypothetical protein